LEEETEQKHEKYINPFHSILSVLFFFCLMTKACHSLKATGSPQKAGTALVSLLEPARASQQRLEVLVGCGSSISTTACAPCSRLLMGWAVLRR
jgi:hypothetical protein